MKPCRKCGEEKPLEEFSKKKANKDGRSCECYECKRKRDMSLYYNSENRRDRIKKSSKQWYEDNPEVRQASWDRARRKRLASLLNVESETINRTNVFNRDRWRCQQCNIRVQDNNRHPDNAAHCDHIIPVSRGGPHLYTNVQTLCKRCNLKKGNKLIGQLRIAM